MYGAAGMLGGGLLFEVGKRYVKAPGSHQFQGKVQILPFFFSVLLLGWMLQHLDPLVNDIVYSVPAVTRLGIMVGGTMALLNYSIDNFNYTDQKSVAVYVVGLALIMWPSL